MDIKRKDGAKMPYTAQLAFLRSLLKGLHISSCVLEEPGNAIPPEIDLGLRAGLFGIDNYATFLQNSFSQVRDRTVYRFFDEYDCNYIFLRLPEKKRYFFLGPYLLAPPAQERIAAKASSLGLNVEQTRRMQAYYTELPILEDENILLTMANTFAAHLWGAPEQYTMEYLNYAIPDRYTPIPVPSVPGQGWDQPSDPLQLERSYADENFMMEAVSKGKQHLLTAVASTVYHNGAEQRLPDSLRDRKNYLIILKTLLRKAAEYGGVHPMHIHRLSSHYAAQIEAVRSIRESLSLQDEMVRSFCQLVRRHSLSRYSYYVGRTIVLVQTDLTADLRLKTIAEKLNVNSSYLSDLFHREYGCTLTEFVNKERIDRSILLLQMTAKPVQEIAAECGIQDVNYFIKLFKKQTGLTPKLYRAREGQQR